MIKATFKSKNIFTVVIVTQEVMIGSQQNSIKPVIIPERLTA
jgi:hypothetical protein